MIQLNCAKTCFKVGIEDLISVAKSKVIKSSVFEIDLKCSGINCIRMYCTISSPNS